jgi:hypothetical protein
MLPSHYSHSYRYNSTSTTTALSHIFLITYMYIIHIYFLAPNFSFRYVKYIYYISNMYLINNRKGTCPFWLYCSEFFLNLVVETSLLMPFLPRISKIWCVDFSNKITSQWIIGIFAFIFIFISVYFYFHYPFLCPKPYCLNLNYKSSEVEGPADCHLFGFT